MLDPNSSFYADLFKGADVCAFGGEPVSRKRLKRRSNVSDFRRLDRQKACRDQIEALPQKGHELVLILSGNWNGWDIIPTVLELSGKTIAHLRIATLGFNDRQTEHLGELMTSGQIRRCSMVVSEMFACKSTREFGTLKAMMTGKGRTLARSRNHAKLLLFEMTGGAKFAAHGSLNLRTCRSYEQLVLANSPDLHDFFRDYIEDLLRSCNA